MKRAILVALGIGTIVTSAAALSIGTSAPREVSAPQNAYERARVEQLAREEQRDQAEARYMAARARCESLGGARRDACFINAHAARGRLLLEIQAPYERARG